MSFVSVGACIRDHHMKRRVATAAAAAAAAATAVTAAIPASSDIMRHISRTIAAFAALTFAGAAIAGPKSINDACPISGKPVDGKTFASYKGQEIGFCCAKCDKTPRCSGWTLAGSVCYLKTCDTFATPNARMAGAVSGVRAK